MATDPGDGVSFHLSVLDIPGLNCVIRVRPVNGRAYRVTVRFHGEQPIDMAIPRDHSPFLRWLIEEAGRRRSAG